MSINIIKKNSISDQIFQQLLESIAGGQWKSGHKIMSENELSTKMGVSRNSVRTAIQKLVALGLLEARQGEGTFVTEQSSTNRYMNAMVPTLIFSNKDVYEMLEFRKIVETETARLAAIRATPEDVKRLEDLTYLLEHDPYEKDSFAAKDMEFHRLIAEIARNSVLNKVLTIIEDAFLSNQIKLQEIMGPKFAFIFHPQLVEAIRQGDGDHAARIMKAHIEALIDNVEEEK